MASSTHMSNIHWFFPILTLVSCTSTIDYCQQIESSLCSSSLLYNWTILPNVLGHEHQENALLALNEFIPLVDSKCSQHLRLFLCSLYFPVCVGLYKPIRPCRSLCQKAKNPCKRELRRLNLEWPNEFQCNEFPVTGLCISDEAKTLSEWDFKPESTSTVADNAVHREGSFLDGPLLDKNRCEKVSLPMCSSGLPYNETHYPNLIGHTAQEMAWQNMISYEFLVESGCSPYLRFFLCVIHAPACTYSKEPIPPCRSLCRKVKSDCRKVIIDLGILWPKSWSCKRYPSSGFCIGEYDNNVDWFWRRRVVSATEKRRLEMKLKQSTTTPRYIESATVKTAGDEISNQFGTKMPRDLIHGDNKRDGVSPTGLLNREENISISSVGFDAASRHKYETPSPTASLASNIEVFRTEVPIMTLGNCENVRVSMCRHSGVPYNWTAFPNSFGHNNQNEAGQGLYQFKDLLESKQSLNLRLFMCSVYIPVCTVFSVPMPPCQSLCEKAREYFERVTTDNWPSEMQCYQYPLFGLCYSEVDVEEDFLTTNIATSVSKTTHIASSLPTSTSVATFEIESGCQTVRIPLCKEGIEYNRTQFPNLFGHENQNIATKEMKQFEKLIESGCSKNLRFFLCSAYAPICTIFGEPFPPCRGLCESTLESCSDSLSTLRITLPSTLECQNFPITGLCVGIPENEELETKEPDKTSLTTTTIKTTSASSNGCQDVTIPFCMQDIEYNQTQFPNILGHANQNIAAQEMTQYKALIESGCSTYLRFFICSLYTPVCTILGEPIPPCQGLCVSVLNECSNALIELQMARPSFMECSNFPATGLCVGERALEEERRELGPSTIVSTTKQVTTYTATNVCQDITMPICTHGIAYNQTLLPNILGHTNQIIAAEEMKQYIELIESGCSRNLRHYLCALYAPVCTVLEEPIPPCKGLCDLVLEECSVQLVSIQPSQPKILECTGFPEAGLCIDILQVEDSGIEKKAIDEVTTIRIPQQPSPAAANECQDIVMPLCRQGIDYNQTQFPNMLGHSNQIIAELDMARYEELIKSGCSREMNFFLCSVYAPVCTLLEVPIPPCRAVCESAMVACRNTLSSLRLSLPDSIKCQRFPVTGLCVHHHQNAVGEGKDLNNRTALPSATVEITTPLKHGNDQCQETTFDYCKSDLSYRLTKYPNILGHVNQDEAMQAFSKFEALINSKCEEDLRPFLCQLFAPMCILGSQPLPPCQSLCHQTLKACRRSIRKSGFVWPQDLQCDKFPVSGLCVGKNSEKGNNQGLGVERQINNLHGQDCVAVHHPICKKSIPYNMSRFPNLFKHENSDIASTNFAVFRPLFETECSQHLGILLCAAHFPMCSSSLNPIPPCRSLCRTVKNSCRNALKVNGIRWPKELRCRKFPVSGLCIGQIEDIVTKKIKWAENIENGVTPVTNEHGSKIKQCQIMTSSICSISLPYNMTTFPNTMGLKNQDEAELMVQTYVPLMQKECSKQFKIFLCSSYFPKCGDQSNHIMLPCKSLCERVKMECKDTLHEYGFGWPEELDCAQFLESGACINGIVEGEMPRNVSTSVPVGEEGGSQMNNIDVNANDKTCESIALTMCNESLHYNTTSFPNLFRHETIEEASLQIHQYDQIYENKCSRYLKLFMCAVHFPPCTNSSDELIVPCRSMCEEVKMKCESRMNESGFNWPSSLSCYNFPISGTCIKDEKTNMLSKGAENNNVTVYDRSRTNLTHNTAIKNRCEKIEIPLCSHNLPYNMTLFPNSLNHDTQEAAGLDAQKFFPLVKFKCSKYIKLFLCIVYTPPCQSDTSIIPCRSLCDNAMLGCESLLNRFGFDWPSSLQCSNFPESESCIKDEEHVIFTGDTRKNTKEGHAVSGAEPTESTIFERKCEKITIPMCQNGLSYDLTSYPNSFKHESQEDAALELHQFYPFVKIHCSRHLKPFLCNVYAPPCDNSSLSAKLPCRSFCSKAKEDCARIMNKWGFSWPASLSCARFPESESCIKETLILTDNEKEKKEGVPRRTTEVNVRNFTQPHRNCQAITASLCRNDLPYNMTFFPNSLQHDNEEDAGRDVQRFYPLIKVKCSKYLKLFLCTLYFPPCVSDSSGIPCRSLCERALKDCQNIMNTFRFEWPSNMQCHKFPESESCIEDENAVMFSRKDETIDSTKRDKMEVNSINNGTMKEKCEDITIPSCQDDLIYNMTSYPNSLEHINQFEAALELHKLSRLTKTQCSKYLKPFLCSLYAPPCGKVYRSPALPCRSFCEKALDGCENVIKTTGVKWPSSLKCKKFPASDSCLGENKIVKDAILKSWREDRGRLGKHDNCEPLTIPACMAIMPYNFTTFSLTLGVATQEDAQLKMDTFTPLLKTNCSKYLKHFLCTTLAPPCPKNISLPIQPCRSLCENVKDGCVDALNKLGYSWPHYLKCTNFPESKHCLKEDFIINKEDKEVLSISNKCKRKPSLGGNALYVNPYHKKCQAIDSKICNTDIPYNITFFPNNLGYPSQSMAETEIQLLSPMINIACSKFTKLFLCAVFFPPCTRKSDHVLPCQSLCQVVKDDCMTHLTNYGYEWPACLECSRFPVKRCLDENTTLIIETSNTLEETKGCKTCEDIKISKCRKALPYNMTTFPNIMGFENQTSAMSNLERLLPLMKYGCSKHMNLFLCSTHFPSCGDNDNSFILPCRSLCQRVHDDCRRAMEKFGFVWPEGLECYQFPESGLCIRNSGKVNSPGIITNIESTTDEVMKKSTLDGRKEITMTTALPILSYEALHNQTCESIRIPFCKGELPYNVTTFPNWFGHTSQEKAAVDFHLFYPLIQVECSDLLRMFLCSSHIPMCISSSGTTVPPCRSVCEKARDSCSAIMKNFGGSWPDRLQCDLFPEFEPCVSPAMMEEKSEEIIEDEEPKEADLTRESCRAITIPFCIGELPYDRTAFPNALGHETPERAASELHPFYPLVQEECSKHLRLFLCSALIPPCENMTISLPCKSLCVSARNNCRYYMNTYGFRWSETLQCDQFPENDVCLRVPGMTLPESEKEEGEQGEHQEGVEKSEKTEETPGTVEPVVPQHQCQALTTYQCLRDVPYNMTYFPNELGGVETQKEATKKLRKFYPLIKSRCSKNLRLLLCSVYAPKCTNGRYIPPCRSLCRRTRKECRIAIKQFGVKWPGVLQCKNFSDEKPCLN